MIAELSRLGSQHMVLFLLVLTRLSTLLMAMPAVGVGVPQRVRALLAIALTALLLPAVASQTAADRLPQISNLVELAIAVAREALLGLLIGTVVQLLITGLQSAGELVTSTGGMQLGDAVDPTTRSSMPTLARLIGLMVTAVMITMGGHRMLVEALMDSFAAMSPGRVQFHADMLDLIINELSRGIAAGARVAAPVVTALLLTNLITGLVSRTLPQINVLAIGLNINALALLAVSALALGSAGWVFQNEWAAALRDLEALW